MILDQFITEAQLARAAFHNAALASFTDAEFLPHLQKDRPSELQSLEPVDESPVKSSNSAAGNGSSPPNFAAPRGVSGSSSSRARVPDSPGSCNAKHPQQEQVASSKALPRALDSQADHPQREQVPPTKVIPRTAVQAPAGSGGSPEVGTSTRIPGVAQPDHRSDSRRQQQ